MKNKHLCSHHQGQEVVHGLHHRSTAAPPHTHTHCWLQITPPFPSEFSDSPNIHGYHFLTFLQMFISLCGVSTNYSSAFTNFELKWNML